MIRHITYLITFIRRFFELFKRRLELDDKKLWIEVPTIYMSQKNKEKTILNAVNILERNIKIK
jgi:hypothetical protein